MTDSANPAGLRLLPPVEPDVVPLPSRRMADGSIVFGLVEDRAPPYLVAVPGGPHEGIQNLDTLGGDR